MERCEAGMICDAWSQNTPVTKIHFVRAVHGLGNFSDLGETLGLGAHFDLTRPFRPARLFRNRARRLGWPRVPAAGHVTIEVAESVPA